MSSHLAADALLGLAAAAAAASTVAAMGCLAWVVWRGRRRRLPDYTPPVTVFKPLKGLDEELEWNLRSFFELDYPVYQLLFCTADPDDPAAAVVRGLLQEFPDRDAALIAGCPAFGLNPKVESLAAMNARRRHDVILISDSNVRVRPEYLRETACYLAEPGVGLVSNLFAGVGELQSAAIMENLHLNGYIAGGVALANALGITCVVGKSMLLPARVLESIGGFGAVRNLLAEDQVIAARVRKAGYSIRLSHHVVENVNRRRGFRWFLNRHSRWAKIRFRMALPVFLFEPTANLATVGLVWAIAGESGIAWGGLAALAGLGMFRDAVQTRLLRGEFPRFRHLIFSPAKDLLLLPVWFDAIVHRTIHWRGGTFHVGRSTRLRPAAPSRRARRRVRAARRIQPPREVNHS